MCGPAELLTRRLTPPRFADYLVSEVRRRTGCYTVAVLYADPEGPYPGMAGVEVYTCLAEYYAGPHPIIAHPPCEAWGRFRWKARQDRKALGVAAMDAVHRWGGVVEQPWRSRLLIEYGTQQGHIETVDQSLYGHKMRKRTDLYWTV